MEINNLRDANQLVEVQRHVFREMLDGKMDHQTALAIAQIAQFLIQNKGLGAGNSPFWAAQMVNSSRIGG